MTKYRSFCSKEEHSPHYQLGKDLTPIKPKHDIDIYLETSIGALYLMNGPIVVTVRHISFCQQALNYLR